MALIDCPECGYQISEAADTCPDCGRPIDAVLLRAKTEEDARAVRAGNRLRWILVAVLVFGSLALVLVIGSIEEKKTVSTIQPKQRPYASAQPPRSSVTQQPTTAPTPDDVSRKEEPVSYSAPTKPSVIVIQNENLIRSRPLSPITSDNWIKAMCHNLRFGMHVYRGNGPAKTYAFTVISSPGQETGGQIQYQELPDYTIRFRDCSFFRSAQPYYYLE